MSRSTSLRCVKKWPAATTFDCRASGSNPATKCLSHLPNAGADSAAFSPSVTSKIWKLFLTRNNRLCPKRRLWHVMKLPLSRLKWVLLEPYSWWHSTLLMSVAQHLGHFETRWTLSADVPLAGPEEFMQWGSTCSPAGGPMSSGCAGVMKSVLDLFGQMVYLN